MSTTPYLEQDTASSHKGDVKNGGSSAEVAAETVDSTPVDGVFGSEERNDIKFMTLGWKSAALLMISEIVSNGMLGLPQCVATVGMFPGLFLIIFLGSLATYTSYLLIQFKLNHPHVHSMGDAGQLLFGRVGREVLSFGTICFAIAACGSEILSGQLALTTLSDSSLCAWTFSIIITIIIILIGLPRRLSDLSWLALVAVLSILVAAIFAMGAIGASPVAGRTVEAVRSGTFYESFLAVTGPVFAFAGHFIFFSIISEMARPQDAMKAAYALQGFATLAYVVFCTVTYVFAGDAVASPSFGSLSPKLSKVAYGLALPNFVIAGGLYGHFAAKILFVRFFRNSRHLHSHTIKGWSAWLALVVGCVTIAFFFATAVPIFSALVSLAAALFAAWYTYGIVGFFWLHDAYHGVYGLEGVAAWKANKFAFGMSLFCILSGAFICVAGVYVSVMLIIDAYATGTAAIPFSC